MLAEPPNRTEQGQLGEVIDVPCTVEPQAPVAAFPRSNPENTEQKAAFEVWYSYERNYSKTALLMERSYVCILNWAKKFGWIEKANERDKQISIALEKATSERTIAAREKHFEAAELLLDRGMAYLTEHGISSAREAIASIQAGVILQRKALEMPDWVVQVQKSESEKLIERAAEIARELNSRTRISSDPAGAAEPGDNSQLGCLGPGGPG